VRLGQKLGIYHRIALWGLVLGLSLIPHAGFALTNLPLQELHTHFRGVLKSEDILDLVLKDGSVSYPCYLLRRLGIPVPEGEEDVLVTRKTLSESSLLKLKHAMEISESTEFHGLESVYDFRTPFLRFRPEHEDLYKKILIKMGEEFKKEKVGYAEMSISTEILDPQWIKKMKPVLEKVEKDTGVKLRFLLGIRRTQPVEVMLDNIRRVKLAVSGDNSYLAGIDFMGEEINSTVSFAPAIRASADIRRTIPNFEVRVHAGETMLFPDNVKEAIRSGATRIGHGVYGIDEETLQLARERNVIVEINAGSNEKLRNIRKIEEIPIVQLKKAGIQRYASTDGGGIFKTTVRDEIKKLKTEFGQTAVNRGSVKNIVFIPGSFDPPTKAHLEMFLTGFEKYNPDKLVIMVNAFNGSRNHLTSFEQRREMILSMIPQAYHDRLEIIKEGAGGAEEVLKKLVSNPKDLVISMIGEDAFSEIKVLPKNFTYKIISRPGSGSDPFLNQVKVERLSLPNIRDISSTEVRNALAQKNSTVLDRCLAPTVERYLAERKFYTSPSGITLKNKEVEFQKAYRNLQKKLALDFPQFHYSFPEKIQFDPTASRESWNDQFLRLIRDQTGFSDLTALTEFETGLRPLPPDALFELRKFGPHQFSLNSSNKGKIEEFQKFVGGMLKPGTHLDLNEIDASANEVIAHKASQFRPHSQDPFVLVEDTSLEVEGENAGTNIRWLLEEGGQVDKMAGKKAKWIVKLAYRDGETIKVYNGVVNGKIVRPKGTKGFGFDPYFLPDGSTQTLAEAKPPEFNARWKAVKSFLTEHGEDHAPIDDWRGPWQHSESVHVSAKACLNLKSIVH
jgi:XTP/dITP diphosphohydrolase